MRNILTICGCLIALSLLYLLLWPVPVDPAAWDAPLNRGFVDPFAVNDRLRPARGIHLGAHTGPEDAALGNDGLLYATSHDGRVLEIQPSGRVQAFVELGGRPLGIEAAADGALIIANAYHGLQRVDPDGSVSLLVDAIDGRQLVYADDVAVADDGTIYFSEASSKFGAKEYGGTYEASLLDILEHGGHGSVIEYRPDTRQSRVLIDGLNFANGVAISEDQTYLLIVETGSYRILKHWLRGAAQGSTEVLIENLPGFPDNINNGIGDTFWVGLVAPRSALLDRFSTRPFLRKVVQRLPAAWRPRAEPSAHVFAVNGAGDVLMNLQDTVARFPALTGVLETRDALYLTSLFGDELAVLYKEDL